MKWTLVTLLLACTLVACASNNVITADAPEMPLSDVKVQELLVPVTGSVRVIFRRDTFGPAHALYSLGVFVDGRHIANIGSGEKLTIYLPPGRHIFGVGRRFDDAVPEREIAVTISDQYQPILRLGLVAAGWGGWKITEASY